MPELLPRLVELITAIVGFVASFVGLREVRKKLHTAEDPKSAIKLRTVLVISSITFALLISFAIYGWKSDRFFMWMLSAHDPTVFNVSKNGDFNIARVFINRTQLEEEERYADIIAGTSTSFDLLAIAASSTLGDKRSKIDETLQKKHVIMRVLLFDPSSSNCDAVASAMGSSCEVMQGQYKSALIALKTVYQEISQSPGRLEVRQYTKMPLYTMWLRDVGSDASLGHIEVLQYRDSQERSGHANRPSITFGREATGLTQQLSEEFNLVWKQSAIVDLSK